METETPVLTRKVLATAETHFTPGEHSMVSWITCDNVDHERDVVVSSGVDYKTHFLQNPVVLAVHDHGRWPLGKCAWIQAKKNGGFNGLLAKTIFDGDEEAEKVWAKVKSESLRGISIGFRPPDDFQPGDWGPPTREELARRPDWKGAVRVIRRCVLLEYSVCSLPMNPQALVVAVNKGITRPVYLEAKMEDEAMEPDAEDKAAGECKCGKDDCESCQARKTEDEPKPKVEAGTGGTEGEADAPKAKAMDDEADDDFDEDDEEDLPIKTRDHVDVKAKGFRGCGMVEKIHRKGLVDHVDEDVVGTKDDPAARVRLYKAHGDGHAPTERKMGVKLSQLTKRAEPFKTPSKKSFTAKNSPMGENHEPLPAVIAKSDQQVRAELIAKLNQMLSPEGFRKIAREEAERAAGFV